MTPALAQPRSSALVQEQLNELDAIITNAAPAPHDDFAAELQRESWQKMRAELQAELAQARWLEQEATITARSSVRGMQESRPEVAVFWRKMTEVFSRLFESTALA